MLSEQQAAKQLINRNWSFRHFEELDKLDAALKEAGMTPSQVLKKLEIERANVAEKTSQGERAIH